MLSYYYRRWSKLGVFKELFDLFLELKKDHLDLEKLNLDGTHSLAKKIRRRSWLST